VFSLSIVTRAGIVLGLAACAACARMPAKPEDNPAPQAFYTVTAEIALARHHPRVAALQYAAAADNATDVPLLQRASQVAADCLQPTVAQQVAAHWLKVDPKSVEAHRAAARAALALYQIDQATAHYHFVLINSPIGTDAELAALETELGESDNVYGARQVADRLAALLPPSVALLRVQGVTALRAEDPAAAVVALTAALALPAESGHEGHPGHEGQPGHEDHAGDEGHAEGEASRRELSQTLARARILAGDVEAPLAAARAAAERDGSPVDRLDYSLLLMAAQRDETAIQQLETLSKNAEYAPVALRLLGLVDFQRGRLETATARFAELLQTGKYTDDAFYYLALIADRSDDPEQALRLYAQVQSGENALPAMLRAAKLLQTHGAAAASEELLDRLVEDEPLRAPDILTARARIYADANDFPRAIATLEQGIADYPDNVDLRFAMASTHEDSGQVSAALRELTQLMKSRPDDPAALNALGYTLADHSRDLGRARKLIERAYAQSPKNAAILDSLGWVTFRQGHAAEAEHYLAAAYDDDRGGDIAAHLGEVLWRLGKPADAQRIWTEASALDPENRLLKETRHRLNAPQPTPGAPQPLPGVPGEIPPLRPVPTTRLEPERQPSNASAARPATRQPELARDAAPATPVSTATLS
jgi:tetratricopeptide (TPR) repeat protein